MRHSPISIKIPLPRVMPAVLGVGAFLKNNLCLIQGNEAWISHDNGSLDTAEAVKSFHARAQSMICMTNDRPCFAAHDLHPDFPSTRFAQASGLVTFPVQHHHAHIAAIMAENGVETPVIGLALDGFGLGPNNESWGGELLHVNDRGYHRLGHLRQLPQPGGDIAARQTWRMGAAALWAISRGDEIASRYQQHQGADKLNEMLERNLNCPLTSSAGRLFDAACGLLGVVPVAEHEGEAPVALEKLVKQPIIYKEGWNLDPKTLELDMSPLLRRLTQCAPGEGADLFHGTLIAALAEWAERAAMKTQLGTVALGGGCFYNRILRIGLCKKLAEAGIKPLLPKYLPFGDPAISLGQAWATALMVDKGEA